MITDIDTMYLKADCEQCYPRFQSSTTAIVTIAVYATHTASDASLVSCPARARFPARNGLVNEVEFLGLITQNG